MVGVPESGGLRIAQGRLECTCCTSRRGWNWLPVSRVGRCSISGGGVATDGLVPALNGTDRLGDGVETRAIQSIRVKNRWRFTGQQAMSAGSRDSQHECRDGMPQQYQLGQSWAITIEKTRENSANGVNYVASSVAPAAGCGFLSVEAVSRSALAGMKTGVLRAATRIILSLETQLLIARPKTIHI